MAISPLPGERAGRDEAAPERDSKHPTIPRLVRQLARRQEALCRRISRIEEEADSLALDAARLAERLDAGVVSTASDVAHRLTTPRHHSEARDVLRRTAEAGATHLLIVARADGSADVQVDGSKQVTLPPSLVDLLKVLALDRGATEDKLVGWKPLSDIVRLLEKRTGRPPSLHAVTQQIYRLRRELLDRGGINPYFVQTSRRHGARFALRRGDAAPTVRLKPDATYLSRQE